MEWALTTAALLGLSCVAAALGFGGYAGTGAAQIGEKLFWLLLALSFLGTLVSLLRS